MTKTEYHAYLRSERWKTLRAEMLGTEPSRCQRCGRWRYPAGMDLHHVSYERVGHELPEDLERWCSACHAFYEKRRRA